MLDGKPPVSGGFNPLRESSMTWFSLPVTQADNKAAFSDADSAARWLAGQPQANTVAMLASLVTQIESFNAYGAAPDERLATLEALRQAVFAVSAESWRRYEYKPLPLLPAEQSAFDGTRRLWRAFAVAYLHCLRACLEQDSSIAARSATVTHRVLTCLRMEQMSCYFAAAEPDGDFWRLLHSVWAGAEQLGVERQALADRLLRETLESTASGHYCMALLLHLARPFALSRRQFSAATRWFARWREQARVLSASEAKPRPGWTAIDLSSAQPIHDPLRRASVARWLSPGAVLGKMRERIELLASGQSPESLKLGSGLSSQECVALLAALGDHLTHPQHAPERSDDGESILLAAGIENVYRLLGGAPLKDSLAASTSSFASQLVVEQIAVFGHVVRERDLSSERAAEIWRVVRQQADELQLTRPPGGGEARLVFKALLAIRLPAHEGYLLATVSSLRSLGDGRLCVGARLLAGKPTPLLAEVREKPGGKISRHAAVLLAHENGQQAPLMVMPAGLAQRALSIRFFDAKGQLLPGLRLLDRVAQGGDSERWTVAV
jgi:hypothetical protein